MKANKSIFVKLLIIFSFLMISTMLLVVVFLSINQSDVIIENIKYNSDKYIKETIEQIDSLNYSREKVVTYLRSGKLKGEIVSLKLEKNRVRFENIKKAIFQSKHLSKKYYINLNYKKMKIEYYIPLNKDVLFIEKSIYNLNQYVRGLVRIIIVVVIMILFIFIISLVMLRKWIINPLKELLIATENISNQNYDYEIKLVTNDEFGVVATVFNEMAKSLKKNISLLKEKMNQLQKANEQIKIMATTDELTKIYNRRALFDKLNEDLNRVKRYGKYLGIIMFDIDHFKSVNDTYGHDAGDKVLVSTATIVSETIREIDYIGRYGGEEFVVVVPNNRLSDVLQMAERIRQIVEQNIIELDQTQAIRVTISLGITEFSVLRSVDYKDAQTFIKCADKALYVAKESGRNRVEIYNG